MAFKKSATLFFILIVFTAPGFIWGAAGGKISGKVIDASTKQPLFGANVFLEGTSMGAATNMNGRYTISGIPPGSYNLRVSYIGYKSKARKIQVKSNVTTEENFSLLAVAVKGKAVVVTAQASGQNQAINQQLSSSNIVNVVSAAKIQELPDENAAESVGRLPGVFLVRSYGEGSEVAIRGLEPKYNRVMIDGVELPASASGNRSVDLSMISSSMLSGIELYKTVTPDMDAAVLGGSVNFQIREAEKTSGNLPELHLSLQGGYNNLQNTYNDYKFTATIGKRFLKNRLGILAQGIIQRQNLTANIFGGGYFLTNSTNYYNPGSLDMGSLNLSYKPTIKHRYDGTLVLDYKWSGGKVDLMNFLSRGTQTTETYSQNYNISGSNITFGTSYFTPVTNVITNILDFKQQLFSLDLDAKISHAYTENINPGYWSAGFTQAGAGLGAISKNQSPEAIAKQAFSKINLNNTFFDGISTNKSFTRQRNIVGSLDISRRFNFSDFITANLKFGGKYRYTIRSYNYSSGGGTLLPPGNNDARAAVIAQNSWMTGSPYNMNANGNTQFPIIMFFDQNAGFGNFLSGNYEMAGHLTNIGLLANVIDIVKNYQRNKRSAVANPYSPDEYANIASNYSGNEYENAAYIMATINFGPQITLIPGVRYQALKTSYTAAHIPLAYENNTYPDPFPHTDSTTTENHGYWLPDISLRYKPFTWMDVRLSYTNTLAYPDFSYIVPKLHIFTNSVDWNNYLLKPARSQNYDAAVSVYDNNIGLLTIDPFLKRIDDLIFPSGGVYITNPSVYPGLPSYTRAYLLSTQINDPYRVDLWGVELDWQTHFWYLPDILSGLVLNVNFTHIFSQAKYPFVLTKTNKKVFPPPPPKYIDTTFTSRLINQPDNILNLSVGYDYKAFSARVSLIYQDNVFQGNNFYPQLRQDKATYTRWDFSAKQDLPWYNLEVYLDINNINGEPDMNVIEGNGFPASEQSYGLTGDIGIRWRLE